MEITQHRPFRAVRLYAGIAATVYTWYEDFVHHIAIERSHFSA